MNSPHDFPSIFGFILAVVLIGTLFFGVCASAAVNADLPENTTILAAPGDPAPLSPEPAGVSVLHDEGAGPGIHAHRAPVNPDLLQYLKEKQEKQNVQTSLGSAGTISDREHGRGYLPPPFSMSYLQGSFIVRDTGSSTPYSITEPALGSAASYDLRTVNKVTPVKNQLTSETCWAFATYASLESFLMPGESWSFSENNMKNLLSSAYPEGYDRGSEDPGNFIMSTAYLTRWTGPINQSDDPFNQSSSVSPTDRPVRKHVQNVYFIPDRTGPSDNTNIQTAVQEYGGVMTSMRWEGSESYWNEATSSYYYMGPGTPDHAVTIVGWDDNYDKSNFSTAPLDNGAFIVKNSWGSEWGDNGYFYISYHDTNIGKDNAVFTAESPSNYNHIYQYDPLGMVTQFWIGSMKSGWMTNVFTSTRTETLSAVSFYTTDTNTVYQVSVYKNPNSGTVINSSGPAWSESGTFGNAGYHTVTVSPGVSLTSGDKFSIVVRLTNPTHNYWAATEYYNASPAYSSSKATASSGQSYYSTDGIFWTDLTSLLPQSNFCIKAFTDDAVTIPLTTKIGVFRPSTHMFYLDANGNGAWNGAGVDRAYTFGLIGDIPVTGDWNRDGKTDIGVFRPSTHMFYLDANGNGAWNGAGVDRAYTFGLIGDIPVTGDWNRDGKTDIGVFRPSTRMFYLDNNGNGVWNGAGIDGAYNFGLTEDIPVTGDWNRDGKTDIGVFRPSTRMFYLDNNGNGIWNGTGIDGVYNFGLTGDTPVSGKWA
jgi:C1A family cysteine protease